MKATTMLVAAGAALGLTALAAAQSTDTTRAYNADLVGDAASRSSFSGAAAGPVKVGGMVQFRYTINSADQPPAGEDATLGFSNRRTKLTAETDLGDGWSVFIQGAFSSSGGGFGLESAYGKYEADGNWTWMFGQFKLPYIFEESTSSTRQLAADRSATNEYFNQDYSQGVQATYGAEDWRFQFAFSDGLGSRNTNFMMSPADYAFTGRFDFKGAGAWDQFKDFTSPNGSAQAWRVGAAAHWQSGGSTGTTADTDVFGITVDGGYEADGWSLFAAAIWQNIDSSVGTTSVDQDDLGFLAQGGVYLSEQTELFGRYDIILGDDDVFVEDTFSTITVGVNHYYNGHAAKATIDVQYFLDQQGGSPAAPSDVLGLVADGGDGQFAVRGQLQFVLN